MSREQIASRYDAFRKGLVKGIPETTTGNNRLVVTPGILGLGDAAVVVALNKVAAFDDFTEDNDPYGEHDFGTFTVEGEKCFWKIDNYNGQEGIDLLMTVMLAWEY